MENTSQLQIIAFVDNVTECQCCGKKDLKGTYAMAPKELELQNIQENDVIYYGRVCGARAAMISTKELDNEIKKIKTKKETLDFLKTETENAPKDHKGNKINLPYIQEKFKKLLTKNKIEIKDILSELIELGIEIENEANYYIIKLGHQPILLNK